MIIFSGGPSKDSLNVNITKDSSVIVLKDTISSEAGDTLKTRGKKYILSKDAIEEEVQYEAKDSSVVDIEGEQIQLFNGAAIKYEKMQVSANYMVIRFDQSLVEGYYKKDSLVLEKEICQFTDGENNVTYKELKFNFKSKKGLLQQSVTQQGEFNLNGAVTKYIGGSTDSTGLKLEDVIYEKNAIISPCNHNPPHFGVRAGRFKFIPNKVAVLSLAQVEIARVPTPLILPFGFFPLIKGKSSGLIFPSSYEYNEQLGLGFREVGYYYPINDYVDMRITGDIYTRGSHGIRVNTSYRKRYGYSGSVLLGYSNNFLDNEQDGGKLSQKSFVISVRHSQDSRAHPFRNLGGSINIQTNRYDQRVYENPQAALTSQYSSNFTFSHDMPGTPFRFAAEFRHSQNTQTRVMDITLPNMTLRMNTIFPFRKRNSTKERWTDQIALSYSSEFRNFVKTTDTTLFTTQTLRDMQTGLQHRANLSTNFRMLKYFNVSPSIAYDETWLTKKYTLTFQPDSVNLDPATGDTLNFKAPVSSFENEFNAFRNLTASVSMNTQIFGTKKWSGGFLRGVRHVVKPTLSLYYKPENKERYEEVVNTDTRQAFNQPRTYSIFTNGPFGSLAGSEEQLGVAYGITNVFEAKYWSKKDSMEKVVRLFDNISVNGTYNGVADSLKWSPLSINGNTTVLKGLTNFNFRAVFSPYVYDLKNRITRESVWSRKQRPLEFRNFSGQFSTGITFGRIREMILGKKEESQSPESTIKNQPQNPSSRAQQQGIPDEAANSRGKALQDISLAQWFENFNISHALNFELRKDLGRDTFFISSHSINISGSIPLTKNWTANVGNIAYDLKNQSFVYPYFSFARDLHCWQMNFTWAPANGVYSFYIGVKSSAMSFLKYDYGQRNANTLFSGRR